MGARRGAVCLHDAVLREITETEHEIRFLFQIPEQADGQQGQRTVVLHGCTAEYFNCYFVRRYAPFHRALRISRAVELAELQNMLHAGTWLELIDEFYREGQMYWRLAVKPWKMRGLGPEVTMQAEGYKEADASVFGGSTR